MSNRLKTLQDKRRTLAQSVRAMAASAPSDDVRKWPSAEDRGKWVRLNVEYDETMAAIKEENDKILASSQAITERLNALDADEATPDEGGGMPGMDNTNLRHRNMGSDGGNLRTADGIRSMALQGWMRNQYNLDVSPRHVEAARQAGLRLDSKQIVFNVSNTIGFRERQNAMCSVHPTRRRELWQRRNEAMSGSSILTGGNIVPPESLIRAFELNMLAYGGVEQVADVIVTQTGERMGWPTFDDTGNVGRRIGENQNLDNDGEGGALPAGAKHYWDAYKYTSDAVLVPFELLQDSFTDLPTVIGEMLGERIGRKKNQDYTYGTGGSQPRGIVTASEMGVTTASATAITYDDVIRLEHSIDPAYRVDCGYMCHDSIILQLRLLKDGNGQPIWQSGWNTGRPDTLNAWPLTTNQDMDSTISAGKKTLLYGQFKKYKIRRVGSLRMYRLEERYRDSDEDGFVALLREDGNLLNAGTCPVKHLLQHA